MHDAAATQRDEPIPIHPAFAPAVVRSAPLAQPARQPRRRDGVRQLLVVLYVLFLLIAGVIAFTRGAPIEHGALTVEKTPQGASSPADAH